MITVSRLERMRYQWADVAGETSFFTVNLAERNRTLLADHIAVLREVMKKLKATHTFKINAMVVSPDHLHAIWFNRKMMRVIQHSGSNGVASTLLTTFTHRSLVGGGVKCSIGLACADNHQNAKLESNYSDAREKWFGRSVNNRRET